MHAPFQSLPSLGLPQLPLGDVPDGSLRELTFYGGDYHFLRAKRKPDHPRGPLVRVVDMFAGCGGLSLGVKEACRTLGLGFEHAWAIDNDLKACNVFEANFGRATITTDSIESFFEPVSEEAISLNEHSLADKVGRVDLLVGGPPCQGHSDLNNYTRRSDPKNSLYLYMARAAKVLRPAHVLIENVQGTPHAKDGVVQKTVSALEMLGYKVCHSLIDLIRIGVPQRRRRHLLLASKMRKPDVKLLESNYACEPRDVSWAIGDLEDASFESIIDEPAKSSEDTRKRIDYLFDNSIYELPDSERPPCHRDKQQSYTSVYGRLRWDRPAQTITSGFYSMCMGRYVHPSRRRTITAHEAARLQFFPDFFDFRAGGGRTALATMIGNVVPMKLSYAAAVELLRK